MATRGNLGGLSKRTIDAADVLDAAGYDIIIFETVGVGQSELDIAEAADTTIVVLVPESGDAVQAMKAGLMEIADLFVMNKSDRPGSQQAVASLQTILMMRDHDEKSWMINIIRTIAVQNKGIDEIANEIERHKEYLISNNLHLKKREQRTKIRIKNIVEDKIREELWSESGEISLNSSLEKIVLGKLSPYHIAEKIIEEFKMKRA
jgi:LAO/AO transport system kinase